MTLTEQLHSGNFSLVVSLRDEIHTYSGRGISDLYHIYPGLSGAEVADKVVGKGAAALMILGKVKRIHADVISEPALSLLKHSAIDVTYTTLTPNIINRSGSGLCPVEERCLDCSTAEECLQKIAEFINANG